MPTVLQPGFMDKPIVDKDGIPLTDKERAEYWDDVFDCGIPMSHSAAVWLWEKWGKRLGLPKPSGDA